MKQEELDNLRDRILQMLISHPDIGMGEFAECSDTADDIVYTWINDNEINITQ